MDARGLDRDGTIAREGALDRVPSAFVPVVDAARATIAGTFDATRLHSAYLYGSIPRGTATPGVSDLDLQLVLHAEPTAADRADARAVEAALDGAFPRVDGVGPDLADELPRYRPTSLLARETNGDLALLLPRWRAKAAETVMDTGLRTLGRRVGRRLARTGFTLIMPRWGGWTSDLEKSAELFGRYYPERAAQMRIAASTGRAPCPDRAVLGMLVDDLGPWLAAEYTAVHGEKDPRP
ncbi:nucleotidyltransferase [Streptomyces sp. NPDC015127]|uniref:nucleotidyltransferase domain-containing protein n=1 Tax=Streptomyces sp. NPDC015127 TaxID=3364939 RepID=UPI0036FAFC25